jgi:hypothetical protein
MEVEGEGSSFVWIACLADGSLFHRSTRLYSPIETGPISLAVHLSVPSRPKRRRVTKRAFPSSDTNRPLVSSFRPPPRSRSTLAHRLTTNDASHIIPHTLIKIEATLLFDRSSRQDRHLYCPLFVIFVLFLPVVLPPRALIETVLPLPLPLRFVTTTQTPIEPT